MKKYAVFVLILFFGEVHSQDILLKKIDQSKSGNFKDVFYNIMQLSTKNISRDEKTLELSTTFFKLFYNADLKKTSDLTIKNSYFLRNFQIDGKIELDKNYKTKGFAGGFNYAIINQRDKVTLNLAKSLYGKNREIFIENFRKIQSSLAEGLLEDSKELEMLNNASDDLLNGIPYDSASNPYYEKIKTKYKEIANTLVAINRKPINPDDISSYINTLEQLKKSEIDKVNGKILWTIAADGATNTEGKFNKCAINTIFLKGILKSQKEIDLRGSFVYDDTNPASNPKTYFNGKAGLNFNLLKNSDGVSCLELKALGEYNKIFKNPLAEEENETIFANTEIRIQLAKEFWIPITLKYDIKNSNFLGFLNLSYNFESFKDIITKNKS